MLINLLLFRDGTNDPFNGDLKEPSVNSIGQACQQIDCPGNVPHSSGIIIVILYIYINFVRSC